MAKFKSSASQAIKDMLEDGLNVSFFMASVTETHVLNAEIGIITQERVQRKPKAKKAPKFIKPAQQPKAKPTHTYSRRIAINIDGTVSIEFTEWDYK